jgi:hypothetical protein
MKTFRTLSPFAVGLHKPRRSPLPLWALSLALLGLFAAHPKAHALSIELDTSALSAVYTDARLEITLLDGDFAENNQAKLSGIATDGSLGALDCSVSCTTSPPVFTLSDTGGLGQFLQDLSLGSFLHFKLELSNVYASGNPGAAPDRLVVSLLDPATNLTLAGTNLDINDATSVQDALVTIDFAGNAGHLIRQATVTDPAVGVTVIPSPGTLSLTLPWALWLAGRGRRPSGSALPQPGITRKSV